MRDLLKLLIVGVVILFAPIVSAESYKLLILPDNIVTQNVALDSFIYDATAEFFSDEVSALINTTDNIKTKTASEVRADLKNLPTAMIAAKELTGRFKTSYNVDYDAVKKIAKQMNCRYVLLITSTIDAENYILRRTLWDFLNIPGATVVDPAYKINTYAVLVDSETSQKLWSDTYYKTISTVENRIITRGASPQTEQLSRIKDYSRYICPQIAQNVQIHILPPDVLARESNVIDYDIGNIDNVFTKKYRHLGHETGTICKQKKEGFGSFISRRKEKHNEAKIKRAERQAEKQRAKLEVQAKQVYDEAEYLNKANSAADAEVKYTNKINTTVKEEPKLIKSTVYKSKGTEDQSLFDEINIKKTRKNNLFGEYDADKPYLRDYSKL